MDRRQWIPILPLFKKHPCAYCGCPADSTDHTPPKCLLPRDRLHGLELMTVPACAHCNQEYSNDEQRFRAILAAVSFAEEDRVAFGDGGEVFRAMEKDARLRELIHNRLSNDGFFQVDDEILQIVSRVMAKTAAGILFYEFGKVVPIQELRFVGVSHSSSIEPTAFIEQHRRNDALYEEVTPSCRQLERQVLAMMGHAPRNMPKWKDYVPGSFAYMFLRRSNQRILVAMNVHQCLTVLVEGPWPKSAGPRRGGKPPLKRKKREV